MTKIKFNEEEVLKLLESPEGAVAKHLLKTAIKAERTAKRLCPVDTGRLRSSISHSVGKDFRGLFSEVGTKVEYAIYVEFGVEAYEMKRFSSARSIRINSGFAAQPFLRPALIEATK